MKLKRMIKSINFKTLVYLIIFSVSILLVLMISQEVIIKYSYEKYQIRKNKTISSLIKKTDESNLYTKLENIAYNNSVCIEYLVNNKEIFYNTLMPGCGINKNNLYINKFIEEVISNDKDKYVRLNNVISDNKAILSGIKVSNGYVFVYSLLEDTDGANIVLRREVIYITLMVIVIACFISYFLSIKITKPITKITSKAKELGEGNYNIRFDNSDVLEIDELAKTLNHVGEDLSKLDELRRDLMANVSHDLKTPLTMIRAYAEMIRDISYKDQEKMNHDLNIIIEEAERLNILVNDILDLSKLQTDSDVLKIEEFDLSKLVLDIMKRYDILKTTEDYKFMINVPKTALVKADKQKIMQVIYNLVNNAINYTGIDKLVYIDVEKTKKEYIVSVKDTGKGISKEDMPYIWDKYYKNDKKHQRNVVSTGIGLSIVKEILVKHKFDYGVKSILGQGTTFYFKIKRNVK